MATTTSSRFGRNREHHRSSLAPVRLLSATEASKSVFNPYAEMIESSPMEDIPSMYCLSDVLSGMCSLDETKRGLEATTDAENAVATFIKKLLPSGTSVQARRAMPGKSNNTAPVLNISPKVIPDCSAYFDSVLLLIWEVDSGQNYENTIKKLHLELVLMLVWLRNQFQPNDDIEKVIGFYFPFKNKECVIEISLSWSDDKLRFYKQHRFLELHQVQCAIKDAYQNNRRPLVGTTRTETKEFSYPLSTNYLETKNLKQISTGFSIVLCDEATRKIYKHPVAVMEMKTLEILHLMSRIVETTRIALPCDMKPLPDSNTPDYFVFDEYDPPLSKDEAKQHIQWFVDEVVQAVKELHDKLNLAHLDIRLENFCVDTTNGDSLKMIDLDRSMRSNQWVNLADIYGKVDMYICPVGWNMSMLDWKQVGLMIEGIQGGSHEFITKLKEGGEFDLNLYEKWQRDRQSR